jgi:ribosomal subunit interface protein
MIFQFYFKRIHSSNFLKDLSERKIQDVLERFHGSAGLVHMTFAKEKNQHVVQCRVRGLQGRTLYASAATDSIFACIDAVAQKLEAQLHRYKVRYEPQRDHIHAMRRFLKGSSSKLSSEEEGEYRYVH